MELSSNFSFDSSDIIVKPMQDKLDMVYGTFLFKLDKAKKYYQQLRETVTHVMREENKPPTVEDVDLLNADLGQLLVTLQDGGLNFDALGKVAFGMAQSGFEFDAVSGEIKSMPYITVQKLIEWVQDSIKKATNERYLNTVLILCDLMSAVDKNLVEEILVLIDSITELNITPSHTVEDMTQDLAYAGLSFTEDPDISVIDNEIPELFVQKNLVTTKLYMEIEKQLMSLGGFDPSMLKQIDKNLNTPYHYEY